MVNVIMKDGFYQEMRKKLLTLVGEEVTVTFGKKQLVWKFDRTVYENHVSKFVTPEVYMENMIESEIHQIYNLLKHDGIPTKVGNEGIVVLPCKLKSIKVL